MIKAYAAFDSDSKLKPFEYDPGELGANEVEIAVEYCGLCHSDLSVIESDWGNTRYPLVAGHEVIGKVAKVGDAVSAFEIGQAVGLGWQAGYCENCDMCDVGDHNLCSKSQPTIMGRHGGFADKVRASETAVVALPDGIDMASAGPLFCGGITVYNPMVEFNLKPTDKVAVIGIGGLGHMAIKFLSAWGCEVTAFTSSDSKRDEVLEMGAHHTLNSKDKEEIKSASRRFDMIISTVNVSLDWAAYLSTLAPRGRLHFVGVVPAPLDVRVPSMMAKQLSISSSPVGSPATIKQMLQFANLHNIQPIVEQYDLSDINSALDRLRSGNARYRIVLKNDLGES